MKFSARLTRHLKSFLVAFLLVLYGGEAGAQWYNPHTWPFTLIPLPEVATDPNAGTTYGLLPVFLFNDEHQQIRQIFAPDITGNTLLGAGGTFRYLSYPSDDTQWYVIAGAAQEILRRVDLYYSTGRRHRKWWSFDGRFFFERDPTERFFGLGNSSQQRDQSNYTRERVFAEGAFGLNITPELQVALIGRPAYVRILPGALSNQKSMHRHGRLPFIGDRFPGLKGLDGGTDMLNRLMISYDTRDSPDIPHSGGLLRAFASISDRHFISSTSYTQIAGEVRRYLTLGKRVTLAGHLYVQYTPAGRETPFWAMSRLGGQESLLSDQQTLRGYGAGRFVDNNVAVVNLEIRTKVYELDIFDTHGILELAPFVEGGRVFHDASDNPAQHMHPVGGIGFRGIAEPFVVGFVDVGYGREGTAVFSGINYPF